VAKDNHSEELYVLCEECECEWESPEASKSLENATRDLHGPSTLLERDELLGHQWHDLLW
jgi:hypothetical protein